MMKTVLIITGVFPPEPIVSAGLMRDLAFSLSRHYRVVVLHPRPSRPMGFTMPPYDNDQYPFEILELQSYIHPASSLIGRFRESYSMGMHCVRYLEEHHDEIDLIYNAPWHLFARKMVAKRALRYGIPYITPVQDIYPESLVSKLPVFLRRISYKLLLPNDRFTLCHANYIHTISSKMVDYLSVTRSIPKDRFVVVRNWQDEQSFVDYFESRPFVRHSPFTFMYLGNIGPLAGIDVLFEALRILGRSDVRLVVAGSGSDKERLQRESKEYRQCNIEFWEVPAGKVPEIQDKADVMLLPVKKGFAMSSIPSKLPAYMLSSRPVIASVDSESDTALCVLESNCGWIVPPEEAEPIAEAMRDAIGSVDSLLEVKGRNGFRYAMKNFSKTNNLGILTEACVKAMRRK